MPRVKMFKQSQKDKNLKIAIQSYMTQNDLDAEKISKKMKISLSSFYKRMKNPSDFRVSELRSIDLPMGDWGDIL